MICETCNDTHRMTLRDQVVMCTRCPTPCQACRVDGNGPFCTTTPCACACHAHRSEESQLALAHIAGGDSPPLRSNTAQRFARALLERDLEILRLKNQIAELQGNPEPDKWSTLRGAASMYRLALDAWQRSGDRTAAARKADLDHYDTKLLCAARAIGAEPVLAVVRAFLDAKADLRSGYASGCSRPETCKRYDAALEALRELVK